MIPVLKPLLPVTRDIVPYLERIDENRYYSNQGPLVRLFEERLATHFSIHPDKLVTSANGTLALTQLLNASEVKKGSYCVMPSWTFVATPASVINAGLIPFFIDVGLNDWAIHPEDVRSLMRSHDVGAVIVVSPFGANIDVDAWEKFYVDTGVPVIIDAAAGFDSQSVLRKSRPVSLPTMVSLHATKVFGIGEGAVVLSNNEFFSKKIRMHGNFGFHGSREAILTGTNTKLNEYMGAVGLAALDNWEQIRREWQDLSNVFAEFVQTCPQLSFAPRFNQGWVSSYGIINFRNQKDRDRVRESLKDHHIDTIAWWGKGCHTQAAYQTYPQQSLPHTESLSSTTLGLPFWRGLQRKDYETIFGIISTTLEKDI